MHEVAIDYTLPNVSIEEVADLDDDGQADPSAMLAPWPTPALRIHRQLLPLWR